MTASFIRRFHATALKQADKAAILYEGKAVSYAELAARAAGYGRALLALGAGRETLVGLRLEKSPELIAALLGVWEAGAAFVPLDPSLPPERLDFIARDAG